MLSTIIFTADRLYARAGNPERGLRSLFCCAVAQSPHQLLGESQYIPNPRAFVESYKSVMKYIFRLIVFFFLRELALYKYTMSAPALGLILAAVNTTATGEPDPATELPFNYVPTGWVGITFLALFGITTAAHLLQSILFRTRYMIPTLTGGNIMLVGIIVQFVAVILFTILALEFVIRFSLNRPARKLGGEQDPKHAGWSTAPRGVILMLVGLGIATLFIVIRSVYRTIELTDGWNGVIISTEKWFNWFDGMPIFVAMLAFNVFHPGYLLRDINTHRPVSTRGSEDEIQLRKV
ncbi:hypothetical protein BDV93DRAFT_524487 [Ceratobasidium sp. AG-I]|nr:hypothetical protein BDV93DRAFT_524487 [Ceratobasidium sp. AG-I]